MCLVNSGRPLLMGLAGSGLLPDGVSMFPLVPALGSLGPLSDPCDLVLDRVRIGR